MSYRTTALGSAIIKGAESVLNTIYIAPKGRNCYGKELEEIVKEFDASFGTSYFRGAGKKQVDYCGIVVSVALNRAFQAFKGINTPYYSASARYFLTALKGKVEINKTPAPGCLFLTRRGGGSGYHVGIVWKVDGNAVETIEGNTWCGSCFAISKTGCKVKSGTEEYGILTRKRPISRIAHFVHIQNLYGEDLATFEASKTYLADAPATAPTNEKVPDCIRQGTCGPVDWSVDYTTQVTDEGGEGANWAGNTKKYWIAGGAALGLVGIGLLTKKKR